MKERLNTLLFAMCAAFLSYLLLSPPKNTTLPVTLPTTEDNGKDGLKGLYTWLQQQNLPVLSYRNKFSELNRNPELSGQGNILIMSIPVKTEILLSEWSTLSTWVEQGNTLIILGAVYGQPMRYELDDCVCDLKDFLARFDWNFFQEESLEQKPDDDQSMNSAENTLQNSIAEIKENLSYHTPVTEHLIPQSSHNLLSGVNRVETVAIPYLLQTPWTLKTNASGNLAMALLKNTDQETTAWLVSAEAGQIYLIATPDIFSNAQLNHDDNAKFFINMLNQSLSEKGKILFDDYHFGISELYDPNRFFQDSRLHLTLTALFIFWLCYVIGDNKRLAPVRPSTKKLSAFDTVDTMSNVFARRMNTTMLAEELVKHLCEDISRRWRLADEQSVWQWLHLQNRIDTRHVELLTAARNGQKVSLYKLTQIISQIRTLLL